MYLSSDILMIFVFCIQATMAHIIPSNVYSAVLNNDINKLTELIRNGKRVDIQDNMGNTPLHVAARKLNRGCLNILLNHPDCEIDLINYEGATALFIACENESQSFNIITDLLNKSANPNVSNHEKITPLHIACKVGNLDVVKLLLNFNADINFQDMDNYTPLHFAVDNNKIHIVEYLIKNNADTSLTEHYGLNPLMLAVVRENEEIFRLLLNFTKNLNATGLKHETALTLAIKVGNLDMIQLLVEYGAKIQNVGFEAPLGVLNLYDEDKLHIFKYIWNKTEHENLSHNISFIFVITNLLSLNKHLENYKIIFETEKLDLKDALAQIKYVYTNLLNTIDQECLNVEYFNQNKESLIILFKGLIKQNVVLKTEDLKTIMSFLKFCPYRLQILNLILQEIDFMINNIIFLQAFCSHPELGVLLLQCIPYNYNPIRIFEKFINYNKFEFTKYLVRYFTPRNDVLQSLLQLATDEDKKKIPKTSMKSLIEISRDVSRNYIGENLLGVHKTRLGFVNIVNQLNSPKEIKDILLYKIPVNFYPDD